jgi:hypothetical protein
MHLLGAVRIMLPRMSGKASGKLMQRLAGLLTLQQPIITRLVVDALDAACDADVSTDVSAGALADVIGRVLELSDAEKRSADESAAVVKLAEKGYVMLHKLDPALSAKRLPGAFHALAANLATEREELIFTTAECLRTLINECVDNAMIQQGISQSEAKAGPSSVERICVCLEGTLGYQYRGSWDMALLVVAEMFQKLGPASYQLLHTTTQTLGKWAHSCRVCANLLLEDSSRQRCRPMMHYKSSDCVRGTSSSTRRGRSGMSMLNPAGLSCLLAFPEGRFKATLGGGLFSFNCSMGLVFADRGQTSVIFGFLGGQVGSSSMPSF